MLFCSAAFAALFNLGLILAPGMSCARGVFWQDFEQVLPAHSLTGLGLPGCKGVRDGRILRIIL